MESSLSSSTLPRESSTHLGTIQVDSQYNLVASCISTDGNYLAVCDAASLFVFQLILNRETSSAGTTTMEPMIPQSSSFQPLLSLVRMWLFTSRRPLRTIPSKIYIVLKGANNTDAFNTLGIGAPHRRCSNKCLTISGQRHYLRNSDTTTDVDFHWVLAIIQNKQFYFRLFLSIISLQYLKKAMRWQHGSLQMKIPSIGEPRLLLI
jgi:hypothetical protein